MIGMEWMLDTLLVVLLAATLFHAVRLERALGSLKRDRSALEALVETFNASTRAAESGIERLRVATDGAGRQIQRQIETATTLKDDLTFLVQRGEGLADRLDEGVRAARPGLVSFGATPGASNGSPHDGASIRQAVSPVPYAQAVSRAAYARPAERAAQDEEPRVRSQAERDLLKALRMVR
jgi:Domain of unknown function (DUF6468)